MFSIRMRASKEVKSQSPKPEAGRLKHYEMHISGAEGLYPESERAKVVEAFIERALSHPRGRPDKITITIEKIRATPRLVRSLPVTTLKSRSLFEARNSARRILEALGVSRKAVEASFGVLDSENSMRGASIILAVSGRRMEPDRTRGVRVSRLGINRKAEGMLSSELRAGRLDNETVREALILASKVASCPDILAEICASDDPGYTTGYVASRNYGYVRIPHMKQKGVRKGGRVFFVREKDVELLSVIEFLEETPVVINSCAGYVGRCSTDEILDSHHS